ncbi:MAG: ABC transporter ATP-binding protein [Alphaproteobacteria bacterium]
MHAVSLQDVSKLWGATRAVDRVSFEAEARALVVLLGPSGCGKSTTLRLIAGLEALDEGRILIDGKDVTSLPPAARRIAMVFQSYALFPHLSVAENILFGLRVRGVAKAEARARLARTADLLGLAGLLERKPSQLSGGQQQRTALGRAIIADQPVCLMDEPLSNLDAQLRQEMRHEIRSLQQKLGITMLYVTHDQGEAMSMADRVVLLREGRVEQAAAPAELYARPASIFAARFIGTPPMNILPLADGPAGAVVKGTSGPAVLEGGGEGLALGLRPEDIVLTDIVLTDIMPTEASFADAGLEARVAGVEYLGADSIVSARVGNETVAVRVAGAVELDAGQPVRLAWRPAALHLFEVKSGVRIEHLVPKALGTVRRVRA